MRNRKLYACAAAFMLTAVSGGVANAAFDESLNMYTLDTVVVEADQTKNKFGDTITEQSYYRTGGDVKVITRDEIEKRHYIDMTDAIKRIPGITFTNPGYRGGEYGSSSYSNTISINGDSRVIILVDGRRVDNSASTRFGGNSATSSKATTDINQIVNMEAVDKIEVIKGPGASAYGADATGGVINIITRKGSEDKNHGTIDLATGSWNKHVYNLSYSGTAGEDKSWHYFISATRQMSGDSKYHDGLTDKTYTYAGTNYKEENANIRIDKDFNDKQSLKIWYNHENGKDGYPITARDYRYWNQADWDRMITGTEKGLFGDDVNPGYRNVFSLDALAGSYNANRNNDLDISYTFNKDNGMESFIRVYNQSHHYWGKDLYIDWKTGVGFPDNPGFEEFKNSFKLDYTPTTYHNEKNRGIELQYGKSFGINDVLVSMTYDKSKYDRRSKSRSTGLWESSNTKRDSLLAYVQDKIHVTDKWDITPSIRYSHYSNFTTNLKNRDGTIKGYNDKGSSSTITPSLNTQYAFSDTMSAYAGWTKVYRPVKADSLAVDTPNGDKLKDEKGNVWTIGLRKDLSEKTSVAVHYDWTDMSNAVTQYSVWLKDDKTGVYEPKSKAVNAKEDKKSFNVTLEHQFNDHWSLGLAYTHLKDKWEAKDGMKFDSDLSLKNNSNVNAMINKLRPANHYTANLSYECNKWYTGLLVNWYTGMDTAGFTSEKALVLDWNLNYEVSDALTTYVSITNLTNEAYENDYYAYNGIGARPQPGRCVMVGARYKF